MKKTFLFFLVLANTTIAFSQSKHTISAEFGVGLSRERMVVNRYDYSPDLFNKFSYQAGLAYDYQPKNPFKISLHLFYSNLGSTTEPKYVNVKGDTIANAGFTKFTNIQFAIIPAFYLNQKRKSYIGIGPTVTMAQKYSIQKYTGELIKDESEILNPVNVGYIVKVGAGFQKKKSNFRVEFRLIKSLGTLVNEFYHTDAKLKVTSVNILVAYGLSFKKKTKQTIEK